MNLKNFLQDSNKNWWVILALSVFIIYESVVITNRLSSQESQTFYTQKDGVSSPASQSEPEAMISIVDSGQEWATGKEDKLEVVLTPLKDINLDGIDLLLEYNPDELEVSSLETTTIFDTVARELVQPENKRVIVSLFELAKESGISFSSSEEVTLLTLEVKPIIKTGSTFVKLVSKTESQPGSQLIEAKTGEQIVFNESQYLIKVSQ